MIGIITRMSITDRTVSYANLPVEVRMNILKYSHVSRTECTEKIMNMVKSPETTKDEIVVKINKNNIKNFMCIVKDMIVSVLLFTGTKYDESHMTLVYGMEHLDMLKYKEIAVAHGINDPEGIVTCVHTVKRFTYRILLHNSKQYKQVLDNRKGCYSMDRHFDHDMLKHRDVLLISIGYPTKNKNTKTYKEYNDMVEKLRKSSYNVKIIYLTVHE